jgi:hypothetical protein
VTPFDLLRIVRTGAGITALMLGIAVTEVPPAAFAAPVDEASADSAMGRSDFTRPDSTSTALLRVYLDGDRVIPAVRVIPLPNSLVRVVHEGSSSEIVSAARVRRIEDEHGRERTRQVLVDGRPLRLGDSPPRIERVVKSNHTRFRFDDETGYGTTSLSIRSLFWQSGQINEFQGTRGVGMMHFLFGGTYRLAKRTSGALRPDLLLLAQMDPTVQTEEYSRSLDAFGLSVSMGPEVGVSIPLGSAHSLRPFASVSPTLPIIRSQALRREYGRSAVHWAFRFGAEWERAQSPVSIGVGVRLLRRGTTTETYPPPSTAIQNTFKANETEGFLLVRSRIAL